MAEPTSDRLLRLLGMVAYLQKSGPVPVPELATQFDVDPEQVLRDVDTLWVSGTPGYLPHNLIDFDPDLYEEQVIRLLEPQGITHPLRLDPREAIALVASVRALAALPALADDEAAVVREVLRKLVTATGQPAEEVDIEFATGRAEPLVEVRQAIATGKRLRIRYVRASDDVAERIVDPLFLTITEGTTYLLAWDIAADGERLFRADRILDATVLTEAAEPHPDVDPGIRLSPDTELVCLHLAAGARWVAETVPNEDVVDQPDGSFRVWLRIAEPSWLQQLLLRIAPDVLGVEPDDQAESARNAALAALAAYEQLNAR